MRVAVECPTGLGEFIAGLAAGKELAPQATLQRRHAATKRGRADAGLARGCIQPGASRHGEEKAQFVPVDWLFHS